MEENFVLCHHFSTCHEQKQTRTNTHPSPAIRFRIPILLFLDPWPSAPSSSPSKSQCFCFPWRATSKASGVKMDGKSHTPQTTNMEPENGSLKDVCPLPKGWYSASMLVFGGAIWCLCFFQNETGERQKGIVLTLDIWVSVLCGRRKNCGKYCFFVEGLNSWVK